VAAIVPVSKTVNATAQKKRQRESRVKTGIS